LELEVLEDRIVPATWYVTATTDNGGDGGVGAGNKGDLRFCVAQAANNDTINLQGVNGQTIQLNSQIKLTQNNLTINDPNNLANVTISGQNNTRLFEVAGGSDTFNNIAFTAGNGNGGNGGAFLVDSSGNLILNQDSFTNNKTTGANTNGGAIENDGSTNVYGCSFYANNAVKYGGAIENTSYLNVDQSQGGTPVQSSFTTNKANSGGAIESNGNGRGQFSVSNSTFDSNQATNGYGGAIWTNDGAILNNVFFGENAKNTASGDGGAVYATVGSASLDADQLFVNSCTFIGNQALNAGSSGGAIYTRLTTDVEMSTFTNNSSVQNGGAITANLVNAVGTVENYNFTANLDTFKGNNTGGSGGAVACFSTSNGGAFQVNVTNDTFNLNNAVGTGSGLGGGLYVAETSTGSGSTVSGTLTNDTFFQNVSDGHGGGLEVYLNDATGAYANATAVLTSLTVYQNQAAIDSGGLYIDSALNATIPVVSVDNNIFSGNLVTAPGYKGPVDVALTNNLGFVKEQYNLVGTSDAALFGSGFDPAKTDTPGLAAFLALNGAPSTYPMTLALQNTSPGYQMGDPSLAGKSGPSGTDERGFLRQDDGVFNFVSIGAEDPDASPS
jgi:predicted outer membrane repeat protein